MPHVLGEVYGWGRYIRGDEGWRSQYQYPKAFHLPVDAAPEMLEGLKKYHVPIYVEQPQLLYNPAEEGYEDADRDDETNRDR
jgi:hypothetical protein